MLVIRGAGGVVSISEYGGQVMGWLRPDGTDVLWRTDEEMLKAARDGGKALRGGVPVCWPWFGAHPTRSLAPSHGLARTRVWEVVVREEDHVALKLVTDGSDPAFPHKADAVLTVGLDGDTLKLRLETRNLGQVPFSLTCALHTYIGVADVAGVKVRGLDGALWRDTCGGVVEDKGVWRGEVGFEGEVDSVFSGTAGRVLEVVDPPSPKGFGEAGEGRLVQLSYGAPDAVVWNPGAEKAANLDVVPDGWRGFVCVEGGVVKTPVVVTAGEKFVVTGEIRVAG